MSGGGGAKKFIVTMFVDHPGKVYLGGAAFLYFYRMYATRSAYNSYFGKFDFQRKLERGELKYWVNSLLYWEGYGAGGEWMCLPHFDAQNFPYLLTIYNILRLI